VTSLKSELKDTKRKAAEDVGIVKDELKELKKKSASPRCLLV